MKNKNFSKLDWTFPKFKKNFKTKIKFFQNSWNFLNFWRKKVRINSILKKLVFYFLKKLNLFFLTFSFFHFKNEKKQGAHLVLPYLIKRIIIFSRLKENSKKEQMKSMKNEFCFYFFFFEKFELYKISQTKEKNIYFQKTLDL